MIELKLDEFGDMEDYCYKIKLTFRNGKKSVYVYSSDKTIGYQALKDLMNDKLETKIFYTIKDGRAVAVSMIEVICAEILPWKNRR